MPTGTSSAIPAHLATLGQETTAGAGRVLRTADELHGALAAFARSGPPDVPGWVLSTIAGDVIGAALRTIAWADGVLDVATAFALAGTGTPLAGAVLKAVTVHDQVVADLLALPTGRAYTIEELAAMAPAQVRAWFDQLATLPGFEDPNFRAISGLLHAVEQGHAQNGLFSIFADEGFDLADAAVLAGLQDAWLQWRGIRLPSPVDPSDAGRAQAAAREGWVGYFESSASMTEAERDESWALAEEGSVRAAEQLLADRGTGFGPGVMALVPFTHSFRYAVANDREGELVESLLSTVDLEPLKDRAGTVAGDWVAVDGQGIEDQARVGLDRLRDRFPDRLEFLLTPIATQVATTAESAEIVGFGLDAAVDTIPLEVKGMDVGELLARVGFNDDLDFFAEALVDPGATPPDIVQRFLDDMIGEPPPYDDPSGAYYIARLTDLGLLRGLSDGRPFPGAVPPIPTR